MLFLPFPLVFGALARSHGVYWADWILVSAVAALALLLLLATRAEPPPQVDDTNDDAPRQLAKRQATEIAPTDVACHELIGLLSDYLDNVLDPAWRVQVAEHLRYCDGCTNYLDQIRATADLLAQLHKSITHPADEATT